MSEFNPYQPPKAAIDSEDQQLAQEVHLAGAGKRFIGRVIDNIVFLACCFLLIFVTAPLWLSQGFDPNSDADFASTMLLVFACMAVPLALEAWLIINRGKSFGKLILKTRIVRARDQGPVGFVDGVLLRRWLFIVLGLIPILGFFIALADALAIFRQSTKCLHDDLAGTIVIDERPENQNPWRKD